MSAVAAACLGGAAFLGALRWPRRWVFAPLLLHPLYLVRLTVGPVPTTALEVLLLGTLVGTVVSSRRTLRHALRHVPLPTALLVGAFAAATTVAIAVSPHPATSLGVWKAMVVEPILYGGVLALLVRGWRLDARFTGALVGGGVLAAVSSLLAGATQSPFARLAGVYDVPNSLALVAAPIVTAAGALFFLLPRGASRRRVALAAVPLGAALVLTQSLGGVAAAALVLAGLAVFLRRRRGIVLATLLLVVIGVGIQVRSGKIAHLLDTHASSLIARRQIWTATRALLRDHPLAGVGLGTFEPAYQETLPRVVSHPIEWVVRDPHNVFLSFWVQTGLLGLLAMSVLLLGAVRRAWAALQEARHGEHGAATRTAVVCGSVLVPLLLMGFVDVPYWKNDLALLWWAVLFPLSLSGPRPPRAC